VSSERIEDRITSEGEKNENYLQLKNSLSRSQLSKYKQKNGKRKFCAQRARRKNIFSHTWSTHSAFHDETKVEYLEDFQRCLIRCVALWQYSLNCDTFT
jgi:hypothetical protein